MVNKHDNTGSGCSQFAYMVLTGLALFSGATDGFSKIVNLLKHYPELAKGGLALLFVVVLHILLPDKKKDD